MKIRLSIILICISTIIYAQDQPVAVSKKLQAGLSFSFNSNGIASIPAFSLDKPALIASGNVSKGRFSWDPTLAYSMELKPWYIDNWLHYKIILRPKYELKIGFNSSTFCAGYKAYDEEILQAQRYFTFSVSNTFKFSPLSSLVVEYWSDNGQEKESIKGHYVNIEYARSGIEIGDKGLLSAGMMLFYINYEGKNDGLFVSPKLAFSLKNIPFTLFCQGTQALQSNISPWPGLRVNIGISYSL